jgi:hypothetical protein
MTPQHLLPSSLAVSNDPGHSIQPQLNIRSVQRTHVEIHPMTGIQDGQVGLLEVVKALGEYITATDDAVRLRGKLITAAAPTLIWYTSSS